MITATQLTDNLKSYVVLQLDNMSMTSPIIGFIKPLAIRALDKNLDKIKNALDLISDSEGNIDVEDILTEMIGSVMNTKPFIFNTSITGDIEIGGGFIKLNLPFTNKRLVLNTTDLEEFKTMLTVKN